ncbi:MAG: AMP phosphorylase [Thermoplasmata archaeon]|nr:MAG: AMP phosphorylase [Thermoplasmata archaeon]
MFKVKKINLCAGEYTVILHDRDAKELGVRNLDRVKVVGPKNSITAIVETTDAIVKEKEVGLLDIGYEFLEMSEGDEVDLIPTTRPISVDYIKKKMNAQELNQEEIRAVVKDIVERNLSDIELAAYVTATYICGMSLTEIAELTKAMVETGDTIEIDKKPVFDFHSIGGVPGNKVTLLVVPIVAAAGLTIPKTSSRAISSACGTADIFEVLANVTLKASEIKHITESIGGVIAWGGGVNIAPADDIIIRAEYPLTIDPYSQVIASVMAKKKAVGADYFLLDIPIGPLTKVPNEEMAKKYARDFMDLGERLNMRVECAITFGGQPIGRAIGCALEAREALMALEGKEVSSSVIEKASGLAGIMLEMGGVVHGSGKDYAQKLIENGKALEKLREIIEAQEGNPEVTSDEVEEGKFKFDVISNTGGYVAHIHNKHLVKIARAAGAPKDKGAGIALNKKGGHKVDKGEVLFTIFADNERKLDHAKVVANKLPPMKIEGMILQKIPSFHGVGGM